MVISDLGEGEGVERLYEGEDRRTIYPLVRAGLVCDDYHSLTKSP